MELENWTQPKAISSSIKDSDMKALRRITRVTLKEELVTNQ